MTEKMTFDQRMADEYDRGIRRNIPSYDAMLRLVQTFLRVNCKPQARLLIVGAGGENELTAFGTNNPDWTFTAVDPADSMLELARMKAEQTQMVDRVEFIEGTVDDVETDQAFDAASCLLVLHFVKEEDEKLRLLMKIRQHLHTGAPLVMTTMYGDPDEPEYDELFALWRAYWLDSTKLTRAEVDEMEKTLRSLSFLPEDKIVALLEQAGFRNIAKFFSTNMFGGWICKAQ
ncbi:SAM-dependent methyltransferases [Bacillus sp. OxB-1]|uniref:class I SAM-dependent methyltransferase n=1 Tax=Bacillus sp. (strain OxB-1) TaxID=98228 RepID=UPI0005820C03|nr:class I SAM-dependent methyltransferase [Bacillus sp. OxB-1]BAQ08808.1 SAM-dependent methyltransferases [Bacillus sp. OxB-1]